MTQFHHVRLELAREPGHPAGDPTDGYDLVAPLDSQGRLDAEALHAEPERGHVRRFSGGQTVGKGRLRRGPGGAWLLDLKDGEAADALGFRFGEERFVSGEYVSLTLPSGDQHTYVVAGVAAV
jgi:hypothetical protein